MNDDLHIYMKKAGENISLTTEERERMRSVIHAYMAMKPLRHPATHVNVWSMQRWLSPRPIAAAVAVAVFMSGAGISYAAEDALPGDALYPIKTNINEPIQGAFAVSPSEKATWASDVAKERLREATILAAEGKLGSTTAQQLQTNFEAHAEQAAASIGDEASTSPEAGAQAALQFDAQLSAYRQILSQISEAEDVQAGDLDLSIHSAQARIRDVHLHAEERLTGGARSNSSIAAAAARARDAARKQLAESLQIADRVSKALATSSSQSIALELDDASATISSGDNLLGKDAPQALGAFQSALSATERLNVFLQTSSEIHKRTGQVIGQPSMTTTTPRQHNRHENGRGKDEGERRQESGSLHMPAETPRVRGTSPATADFETTATGTTTNTRAKEMPQTEPKSDKEDPIRSNYQLPFTPPVLPISVPIPHLP